MMVMKGHRMSSEGSAEVRKIECYRKINGTSFAAVYTGLHTPKNEKFWYQRSKNHYSQSVKLNLLVRADSYRVSGQMEP